MGMAGGCHAFTGFASARRAGVVPTVEQSCTAPRAQGSACMHSELTTHLAELGKRAAQVPLHVPGSIAPLHVVVDEAGVDGEAPGVAAFAQGFQEQLPHAGKWQQWGGQAGGTSGPGDRGGKGIAESGCCARRKPGTVRLCDADQLASSQPEPELPCEGKTAPPCCAVAACCPASNALPPPTPHTPQRSPRPAGSPRGDLDVRGAGRPHRAAPVPAALVAAAAPAAVPAALPAGRLGGQAPGASGGGAAAARGGAAVGAAVLCCRLPFIGRRLRLGPSIFGRWGALRLPPCRSCRLAARRLASRRPALLRCCTLLLLPRLLCIGALLPRGQRLSRLGLCRGSIACSCLGLGRRLWLGIRRGGRGRSARTAGCHRLLLLPPPAAALLSPPLPPPAPAARARWAASALLGRAALAVPAQARAAGSVRAGSRGRLAWQHTTSPQHTHPATVSAHKQPGCCATASFPAIPDTHALLNTTLPEMRPRGGSLPHLEGDLEGEGVRRRRRRSRDDCRRSRDDGRRSREGDRRRRSPERERERRRLQARGQPDGQWRISTAGACWAGLSCRRVAWRGAAQGRCRTPPPVAPTCRGSASCCAAAWPGTGCACGAGPWICSCTSRA